MRFNFITKPCVGNGHNKNLWQYHKDYLNDKITDSELFKFESKITVRNLAAANTRDVETDMLLECLSHLQRFLEMPIINSKINLMLIW